MVKEKISKKAIKFVKEYEKRGGRKIIDVQTKSSFKGFDLISIGRKGDIRFIEVKGTKKERAIPDLFETEVTIRRRLVATHLYVVSFKNPKKPVLYMIPTKEIKPDDLEETRRYRVKSNFRTKKMDKFKVDLSKNKNRQARKRKK